MSTGVSILKDCCRRSSDRIAVMQLQVSKNLGLEEVDGSSKFTQRVIFFYHFSIISFKENTHRGSFYNFFVLHKSC